MSEEKPSLLELLGMPGNSKPAEGLRSVQVPQTRYEKAAAGPTDYENFMHKLEFGGAPAEKNLYRQAHMPKIRPLDGASEDQTAALEATLRWSCGHGKYGARQVLRMGGLAGTGKTTLIKTIVAQAKPKVAVCALTGKAVSVLLSKKIEAQTLHSLIYRPAGDKPASYVKAKQEWTRSAKAIIAATGAFGTVDAVEDALLAGRLARNGLFLTWMQEKRKYEEEGGKSKWKRKDKLEGIELVIVDEASMVNDMLHQDLLAMGIRVMYVGDHGQLEPIGKNPGLMENPDIRLEQIHRQAADSDIIQFAHFLRKGGNPSKWQTSREVKITEDNAHLANQDVVICGYNRTRVKLNHILRGLRGYKDRKPLAGERVICLANSRDLGVYNGLMATILEVRPTKNGGIVMLRTRDDTGRERWTPAPLSQFGKESKPQGWFSKDTALWDWGYAVTAHKSQGSEWDRVAVVEQIHPQWGPERWRYTSVTRAAKNVTYKLPGRI